MPRKRKPKTIGEAIGRRVDGCLMVPLAIIQIAFDHTIQKWHDENELFARRNKEKQLLQEARHREGRGRRL